MAYVQYGSESSVLLDNHLFYLPATLTERWNTHDYDLGSSRGTVDEAQDIVFNIAVSHSEFIRYADMRFFCDLVVTEADRKQLQEFDMVVPIKNILHSLLQV